jgi:hypothetical protein
MKQIEFGLFKMMNIVMRFLFLSFSSVLLNIIPIDNISAQSPQSPSLTEVVLIGLRPANELKQSKYPQAEKSCVREYLSAIPPNSFLWTFKVPSHPEKAVQLKKHNLTEQIVTILGEDVRSEAEAFASAVPLLAEWEGMSEGPLDEANFADNWLSKRPGTRIAPFLYLFKAHRLRAGYEAARAGREKGLWPILAKRYRESLDKIRSCPNSLIVCIADDMERQEYVYLAGQGHP